MLRAITLGTLAIPLNCYWVVQMERVMFGPYTSTISLFANVIFLLLGLVAFNAVLRRVWRRMAFSQAELLIIYTMLCISTGLAGLDGPVSLSQLISHPAWFYTHSGKPVPLALPHWLYVADPEVLRGHFLGNSTLYHWNVIRAWLPPVLGWSFFAIALLFIAQCIGVVVRRQWADHERLTFPIVWLPVAMTEEGVGVSFFRNKIMWAGFVIAAGLGLWNGIAFLYPSLPAIPISSTDIKPLITAKPWSAIDWLPITCYPMVIGLGFLLPVDLLFSCWFFYLCWKLQMVFASAMAWDTNPDVPYIKEQGFGSTLALFGFYLWSGRRAYAALCRNAFKRQPSTSHDGEALTDRGALLAICATVLALLVFFHAAGVALWVGIGFLALFIPVVVVVMRIRAELGAPIHDFHFMGPDTMLPHFAGTGAFHNADLGFFTYAFTMTRAHRGDTPPIGLEGLQMAHMRRFSSQWMFRAVLIATVVGTIGSIWAYEHLAYQLGVMNRFSQGHGYSTQSFERLETWLGGTLDPHTNQPAVLAMCAGAIVTVALSFFRLRIIGFPLHPIGFALSSSWAINLVWFPMLIAWGLKVLAQRYGGLRFYRSAVPFFLGLILGDCVMGSFWGLVGMLFKMQTYNFFGA
jgi:hypothetical protein